MKKSLLIASLLLVGASSLMGAQVGDTTIGIEIGALKSDATSIVNGVESDADISTTSQSLNFAKYYDYGRLGASVGIMNEDGGTDGYFIGFVYDYMFYNKSKFVPFVGVQAGYAWNEWEGSGISVDHDGSTYGVEAGLVYEATDEIDLEIGVRYLGTSIDGSTTVSGNNIVIDVDSVVQYYVTVGYKF